MTKRNPLGRGLESLIPTSKDREAGKKVIEIDITNIQANPNQPRKNFDKESLNNLAESIKKKGVLQPILVEKISQNSFMIIAGERRWRAAGLAGIKKIPAIVIDKQDDKERLEIGLIENVQRESLNPVELAEAYKKLMDKYGYTQEQVASIVGKSRSAVANTLRLLALDEKSLKALKEGLISEGHARCLLVIDDLQSRLRVLKDIIDKELSVREAEKLVSKLKSKPAETKKSIEKDLFISTLEEELESYFETKVDIQLKKKGGSIVIKFNSNDDLNRIINVLRGEL
ncbi:chromosome partitioning protein ParB [Deferribacter desulfuricans SSM1]|uniref:Chromosome partitioning protein ParB n=1 Tax=Deferribacter desulfuricans (strain DSM 14783 / JCM 11476 / NBRC 101012 / SSM1) TaxID=639282 RepID=D3PAL6_DEFDS|nr:ParB/RepB/Spo0J family partition protein [Deferribacter desulfuricans]BAI79639.1 chromosome partitioning protein ParB [Deferribacter desulfuricans SSM1]